MNIGDLDKLSLARLDRYLGGKVSLNGEPSEIAKDVTKRLHSSYVHEETAISRFVARCSSMNNENSCFSNLLASNRHYKSDLVETPASIGEQVAARWEDDNDCSDNWVLATIIDTDMSERLYFVEDEDHSRQTTLHFSNVRRLDDDCNGIKRGDEVWAVFNETSMFYRGITRSSPRKLNNGSTEVVVQFYDDKDSSGRIQYRRVPGRFVLPFIYYGSN